jgi:integrase
VAKSTRKPHYMTASEQMKIEFAAPNYLRNIIVILSEMGLRYKKELLPMKKAQVDLDNAIVYIAESKTANGIGDMPMTPEARDAFSTADRGDAGKRIPFPEPEIDREPTVHHECAKGLGSHAKEGGRSVPGSEQNCKKGELILNDLLVGPPGFEPGTSCTPSKRASQAAPRPEFPFQV